jgi:hypothetical protein
MMIFSSQAKAAARHRKRSTGEPKSDSDGESKGRRVSKTSTPEPGAEGPDTGADTGADDVRMNEDVGQASGDWGGGAEIYRLALTPPLTLDRIL